jgi:hypothetical protein
MMRSVIRNLLRVLLDPWLIFQLCDAPSRTRQTSPESSPRSAAQRWTTPGSRILLEAASTAGERLEALYVQSTSTLV